MMRDNLAVRVVEMCDNCVDQVTATAFCKDVVLPRPPDSPVRIPRVPGVILTYNLVVVRGVAIVPIASNHIRDVPAVHEGIVLEGASGMDLVVTHRECRLVKIINRGDCAVDTAITQIPVPVTRVVVRVDAGVITYDLDAQVADAIVVRIPSSGDLANFTGRDRTGVADACEQNKKREREQTTHGTPFLC